MYKQDLALNNLQWLICHKTEHKPSMLHGRSRFGSQLVVLQSFFSSKN